MSPNSSFLCTRLSPPQELHLGLASGLHLFGTGIACTASFPSSLAMAVQFFWEKDANPLLAHVHQPAVGTWLGPDYSDHHVPQQQWVIKGWAYDQAEQSDPAWLHSRALIGALGRKMYSFSGGFPDGIGCKCRNPSSHLATWWGTHLRAELRDAKSEYWQHPTEFCSAWIQHVFRLLH